jgi:hypothetical protein
MHRSRRRGRVPRIEKSGETVRNIVILGFIYWSDSLMHFLNSFIIGAVHFF